LSSEGTRDRGGEAGQFPRRQAYSAPLWHFHDDWGYDLAGERSLPFAAIVGALGFFVGLRLARMAFEPVADSIHQRFAVCERPHGVSLGILQVRAFWKGLLGRQLKSPSASLARGD